MCLLNYLHEFIHFVPYLYYFVPDKYKISFTVLEMLLGYTTYILANLIPKWNEMLPRGCPVTAVSVL